MVKIPRQQQPPRPRPSQAAALLLLLALLAAALQTAHAFLLPSLTGGRTAAAPPQQGASSRCTRLWGEPPKRLTITEQLKLSPNRWRRDGTALEPGVGGIWPGKPDAKKYKVRANVRRCGWGAAASASSVGLVDRSIHPPTGATDRAGGLKTTDTHTQNNTPPPPFPLGKKNHDNR